MTGASSWGLNRIFLCRFTSYFFLMGGMGEGGVPQHPTRGGVCLPSPLNHHRKGFPQVSSPPWSLIPLSIYLGLKAPSPHASEGPKVRQYPRFQPPREPHLICFLALCLYKSFISWGQNHHPFPDIAFSPFPLHLGCPGYSPVECGRHVGLKMPVILALGSPSEAGGSQAQGQPKLYSKTLSKRRCLRQAESIADRTPCQFYT